MTKKAQDDKKGSSDEEASPITRTRRSEELQNSIIKIVENDGRQLAFLYGREQLADVGNDREQIVHRSLARRDVLSIRLPVAVALGLGLENRGCGRPDRIGEPRELGA